VVTGLEGGVDDRNLAWVDRQLPFQCRPAARSQHSVGSGGSANARAAHMPQPERGVSPPLGL
jgi:hypothetical protein